MQQEDIEAVINSGLFNDSKEGYVSKYGCDYCEKGYATVYEVSGYRNLSDANIVSARYEFQLCADCLNRLYYGE